MMKLKSYMSLPLRECGLKDNFHRCLFGQWLSLPLRECGLKVELHYKALKEVDVTPLAGVWIESLLVYQLVSLQTSVTPLAGVWIESSGQKPCDFGRLRHSPCGSVD